jgi:hypothetical protein
MLAIATFYASGRADAAKIALMDHQLHVSDAVERVIHIPLSEAEWRAFLASTPKPVDWLRERIREAIAKGAAPAPSAEA